MYREALQKAKMAKNLALTNYLEAKRIKNTYMLDDLNDDEDEYYNDSDDDDDEEESGDEEDDEEEILENKT